MQVRAKQLQRIQEGSSQIEEEKNETLMRQYIQRTPEATTLMTLGSEAL